MLDRLLESGEKRKKSAWGGTASVVVHGALIALAVAATAHAREPRPRPLGDPTVYRVVPPADDQPTERRGPSRTGGGGAPIVPRLPLPGTNIDVGPALPDIPLPGGATPGDSALLSEIGGGGTGPHNTLGGTGIATDASVDVPVRALVDRAPAYPETLRTAGISGTVRVRFIIDTTGRAELPSVRVIDSSHELFTRAVLAALRQARFTPGEVSGHRVRTLVERSYRFDIAGAGR